MKRLSLLVTLACITTSTFAQTVNYGSSGLNQTSTTQPILFKNNGTEKVRIGSDGNVGIGTNAPTEKLEVIGNLKVSGTISSSSSSPTQIATIQTSRIKLIPGDTAIRIGDSTLYFIPSQNNIFGEGTTVKGTGIGRAAIGYGLRATALGYGNYVYGQYSTGVGAFAHTSPEANYAIAIGHGLSILQPLINTMQNTLWVGFNSTQPTLFVSSSAGGTTTGNVGIGTTTVNQKLEVNGIGRFSNANGRVDVGFNSVHGYVDSDQDLLLNYYSGKHVVIGDVNHANGPSNLYVSGVTTANKGIVMNDQPIYFRSNPDHNHGLGWFKNNGQNGDAPFLSNNEDSGLDGPVLFGNNGGALGSSSSGTKTIALYWNNNGAVSINTTYVPSGYKLAVKGKIVAEELLIKDRINWPDYVFGEKHTLLSIADVSAFITKNKHLPGIPSAKQIEEGGLTIGEMMSKQMEKIEELTLYMIQLNKEVEELKKENQSLKNAGNK